MVFGKFIRHLRRSFSTRALALHAHYTQISNVTPVQAQTICNHLNLTANPNVTVPNDNEIEAARLTNAMGLTMTWRSSEVASASAYKAYLNAVLAEFNDTLYAKCVHGNKQLLSTKQPWFPFEVHGTTDVFIKTKGVGRLNNPFDCSGVRCIMELKPDIPTAQHHARFVTQTRTELLAADLAVHSEIFAVLTDLRNEWTFLWLSKVNDQYHYNQSPRLPHADGLRAFYVLLRGGPETLRDQFHFTKLPPPTEAVRAVFLGRDLASIPS